jgi:hypothetical protein
MRMREKLKKKNGCEENKRNSRKINGYGKMNCICYTINWIYQLYRNRHIRSQPPKAERIYQYFSAPERVIFFLVKINLGAAFASEP